MAEEPVDIGAITEALNNKTDTDVQNTTTIGSAQIVNFASPGNYTSNLTWGASGAHYTAPDDGWIVAARVSSAGSQFLAIETYNPELTKNIMLSYIFSTAAGQQVAATIPVSKGQVIIIQYTLPTAAEFHFVYAKGSEPQA